MTMDGKARKAVLHHDEDGLLPESLLILPTQTGEKGAESLSFTVVHAKG